MWNAKTPQPPKSVYSTKIVNTLDKSAPHPIGVCECLTHWGLVNALALASVSFSHWQSTCLMDKCIQLEFRSLLLSLNMLNFFKVFKRYLYILILFQNESWYVSLEWYFIHLLFLALEQQYMAILLCRYHACWCSGDFRSQGINRHGIDLLSRNIPFPAAEELIDGQPWLPRTEMDHPTINHGWSTGRPRIFSAALLVHHIPTYLSQH